MVNNGFSRRLEALETMITRQESQPRPDLSRLSVEERHTIDSLRAKAGGDTDNWNLSRLTADDLRILRALLRKAHRMEDTAL